MNMRQFPIVPIALGLGGLAVVASVAVRLVPQTSAPRSASGTVSMGVAAPNTATDFYAAAPQFAGKMMVPSPVPPMMTGGQTAAEADQKIIKTGSLDLSVANVNETQSKIAALATGAGGFVQTSSVNERDDGSKFGAITIRIPADRFDATMAEAKKLATLVKSETANGQDVTEQYTDLEAQLRNAQAQETEYLNILKKAQSVQDILNVQQYLSGVRGTIESLQGRIKYLSNQTSYSTIAITLSEDTSVQAPSRGFRPWEDIRAASQALVLLAEALVAWTIWLVIVGGGTLIPIALVIWGLVVLIKRFLRRRR